MVADPGLHAGKWIRAGLRAMANLLFPPLCTVCGTVAVEDSDILCDACEANLESQCRMAYCPTCARTVPPFVVSDGRCNHCKERKIRTSSVVRVGPYTGTLRTLLRAFKHQSYWNLGAYLGTRLASQVQGTAWFTAVDALVIVPQWWLRRLRSGDYPPAVLARSVSRETGVPFIPALHRVKGGPSQVGLTATERMQNVRGKFAMARGVRVEGATLCLMDDVMTTGATLEECARVLLEAGAGRVYGAVVAQVSHDAPARNRERRDAEHAERF